MNGLARKSTNFCGRLQSIIWLCVQINDVRLSLWLLYIPIGVAAFHNVIEVPLSVVSWFLLMPFDFFQLVFLYSAIMFLEIGRKMMTPILSRNKIKMV